MAELAYVNSRGEVVYKEVDIGQELVSLPVPLESKPLEVLRYNGTAVVDAETQSDFFIDDNGEKWLINDSSDALEVSGTFTLNRRGGPNDAIQRTTGSWVLDGFQVGKFVTVRGSVGADLVYKVIAVSALDLEFDENFERIPSDENDVFITVIQGWQKVAVSFNDVMFLDGEKWKAKTDNQNKRDAVKLFQFQTQQIVDQHVTTESPYPDRHRQPPEARVAASRIVKVGRGETPKWGWADLAVDTVDAADDIYQQTAGTESVEVSFNATGKTITRAAGTFNTNFDEGMGLTVTGSASNDADNFTIKEITGGGSTINLGTSGPDLVDETNVTVTLDGLWTITGYTTLRNENTPGVAGKDQWRRFMEEAVAEQWFAKIETRRKNYVKNADNSTIWGTATAYAVDDYVFEPEQRLFFKCNTAHTSTLFTADSANWDQYRPEDIVLSAYPTAQIES